MNVLNVGDALICMLPHLYNHGRECGSIHNCGYTQIIDVLNVGYALKFICSQLFIYTKY